MGKNKGRRKTFPATYTTLDSRDSSEMSGTAGAGDNIAGSAGRDHSRQSSIDDFIDSGAYVDHRQHGQISPNALRRVSQSNGEFSRKYTPKSDKKGSDARKSNRASYAAGYRDNPERYRDNESVSPTYTSPPTLPLTNRNLQNLLGNNNVDNQEFRSHSGAVVLDMDRYTDEQRQLTSQRSLSDPFNQEHFGDEEDRYSSNSLEFGGSNPSSDHSSDSTSLDDVCFPDYYDFDHNNNRAGEWPELAIMEEFVKEELQDSFMADDDVQFSPNVNFDPVARHVASEEQLPTAKSRKYPSSPRDEEPLLNNYQVNEIESIVLAKESLRVRPTPIQPWEKSKENIPTILNNSRQNQSRAQQRLGKSTSSLCRFTYFREDLNKTIHSPTISGLLGEHQEDPNEDEEEEEEMEEQEDTGEQDNQTVIERLKELFQPRNHATQLSTSASSTSVGHIVTEHSSNSTPLPTPGIAVNLNNNNLHLQPLTKLQSKGTETSPGTALGSEMGPEPNHEEIRSPTPFWLDVLDPTEEEMKVLSKTFGIHPLTTEDIFLGEAREKVELFKSYYFVCFTSFDIVYERRKQRAKEQEKKINKLEEMFDNATFSDRSNIMGGPEKKSKVWNFFTGWMSANSNKRQPNLQSQVHTKESVSMKSRSKKIREGELLPLNMYMIVFKDAVITFHFSPTPHPINVRRRARLLSDYLTVTSDWICYALIDDITDSFAPMIESIEEEVNSIEDAILKMHSGETDLDDLDDEVLEDESHHPPVGRRKKSNESTLHKTTDEIFFRRKRSKSTVDHKIGTRLKKMTTSVSSKSGSRRSSSSKSTGIISWRRKGDMLRRIGECRKRVMSVLRLLGSKADVIRGFSKRFSESMQENGRHTEKLEIGMYLGDIQDHIVTMVQSLNHYEKLIARFHANYLAQINIDMTKVNNDTNDVLGKITILGTIVLPINVVTGLWGMNCIVPGQDHEGLVWFWGIISFMCLFSIFAYNYARRVTGL